MDSGDLSDITAVIQNALRPRTIQGETRYIQLEQKDAQTDDVADVQVDVTPEDVPSANPKRKPTSTGVRKFPSPVVVDVAWSDASIDIAEFAKRHDFSTTSDKYLGVLAWFAEALKKSGITVNEVYTCFRKVGWPTNFKDFSQPLRDLKAQQVITGGSKDGFTINHLGVDRVIKLRNSA